MSRTRLVFSVMFLMFGIIFTFKHHLGFSVGDTMLSAIGLSPYTTSYASGVHITLFLGMGILACSYYVTRQEMMPFYPSLAKRLWLIVLVIVLSYSYMTDKLMYVAKWGASGINGVSYVQNNSSCTYDVLDNGITRVNCDLTLKNYSREPVAAVLLPDLARSYKFKDDPLYESLNSVRLTPVNVEIEPYGTFKGQLAFSGLAESPLQVKGKLIDIVLDVAVDGENTVFDYDIP
ncbi:hypothetical protein JNUCC31_26520 [Paenibacillus sp. JNUCC31]|uniref:hypothetical protein n=1 Tax=unclassified Paenibacillus TaxID=185978 RepID=UPI00177C17AB|nr:hypothetical protein [Paenibacillus sp. JNUCC-31]QOS78234.1 hypothetical protein JNUCC31_26520 [Paenibacillus sp. JNUCC-31]